MNRFLVLLLLTVFLPAIGCDRLLGDKGESVTGVDRDVAEKVLEHVLDRIDKAHREIGPMAAFDVPEYKRLAAKAEGFASWADFNKRLRKTDPSLDVEYSRRITRRLERLLEEQESSGEEGG